MKIARCGLRCYTLLCLLYFPFTTAATNSLVAPETAVVNIALRGSISDPNAELSALGWCDDNLWLVPQYPNFNQRSNKTRGHFYRLTRRQITEYLSRAQAGAEVSPLAPEPVPVTDYQKLTRLRGYQGIEAFACDHNQAYLALEISRWGRQEATVMASARYQAGVWRIQTVGERLLSFTRIPNMGNEALVRVDQGLLSLHEVNSADLQINGKPQALLLDSALQSKAQPPMVDIPYRVTDATELDDQGRFWVINYLWQGDVFIQRQRDAFWQQFGRGLSHRQYKNVERLIELQWTGSEVKSTGRSPIDLLLPGATGRNWEGIVRLGDQGFLLVTDKHPGTLLGFVPKPE